MSTTVTPHSRSAKFIHWGFAALFVYALLKQLDEVEELADLALLKYEIAFASIFLILLAARFIFMHATRPTALDDQTPKRMRRMARAVHLAMYAGLATIAITGLVIGGLYWSGRETGFAMNAALLLHEIAVNGSYLLIAGHIGASIYHRHKQDGLWDSMVPFWKERTAPQHNRPSHH